MLHAPITPKHGGRGSFSALPHQTGYDGQDCREELPSPGSNRQTEGYPYNEPSKSKQNARIYTRTILSDIDELGEYYQHYRPDPTEPYNQKGRSAVTDKGRPNYKPSALRWPFLVCLVLVILIFVGLMAYALHELPIQNYDGIISPFQQETTRHARRQEASKSFTTITAATKASSDFGMAENVSVTSSSSGSDVTETKPSSGFGSVVTITITSSITSTPTIVASSNARGEFGNAGTVTVTPIPTYVTPKVTTLTNSAGVPTETLTSTPSPISAPQTTFLTNTLGQTTATEITSVLAIPSFSTLTDPDGVPTETITRYPLIPSTTSNSQPGGTVYTLSYSEYIVGMFVPTILAIALSVPIRILDLNAKLFQPWHELTHPQGATGRESLCLETSGWQSVVTSVRSLFGGQALVFLTTTLVLCSAILVPMSAEAVSFKLAGSCFEGGGSARNCAYVLSVFAQPARATVGLLGFMGVAVIMTFGILRGWGSGVSTNPWSICGIATLSQNQDVRRLFTNLPAGFDGRGEMPKGLLGSVLMDRRFGLDYFHGVGGNLEYGIVMREDYPEIHPLYTPVVVCQGATMGVAEKPTGHQHHQPTKRKQRQLPFLMLGYPGRLLFLFVLCGILAVILYYNNTGGDTPFERFMDSEALGVRFLFTSVGVVITFFWSSFFSSIAVISPYHLLASKPQYARRSLLLAPPTNAISGVVSGIRLRHGFLVIVALTSILSEVLTIFLSNVPYRVTQTYMTARVCTWSAVAILCIMVLVVLSSFFIKWPHMPVDPSTIAGAMYYVCDSWMLANMEGVSVLGRKERDLTINELGSRYGFGEMIGSSRKVRIGIDTSSNG